VTIVLIQDFSDYSRMAGIAAFHPEWQSNNSGPFADDTNEVRHVLCDQDVVPE
jgi:hypothetical protein